VRPVSVDARAAGINCRRGRKLHSELTVLIPPAISDVEAVVDMAFTLEFGRY
jgi:hypothetical protein